VMLSLLAGLTLTVGVGISWAVMAKGRDLEKKTRIPWGSVWPFLDRKKQTEEAVNQNFENNGHKIFFLNALNFKAVFVGDADIVRQLIKEEVPNVQKGLFMSSPAIFQMMGRGRTILHANGQEWRKHRELSGPLFHFDAVIEYQDRIVESGLELFDYIKNNGGVTDIGLAMTSLAIDVLGKTIFSYDFGALRGENNFYLQAYFDSIEQFTNPLRLGILGKYEHWNWIPSNRKVKESTRLVRKLVASIVEEKLKKRQQNKEENTTNKSFDVVDVLLESMNEVDETKRLDQEELLGDVTIFFVAGHETTASALAWACILLAQHPDIQQKAFEEVNRVLKGNNPVYDDLKELTYVNLVIKEVLRYSNPVSQLPGRLVMEDTQIPGTNYILPKGASIFLSLAHIHHDPQHWKNPEVFDPDRFLPENSKGRHPFAYLPFSIGKRHCIGQHFSILEQQIILPMLLQKYEITLAGPVAVKKGFLKSPLKTLVKFRERNPISA